MCSKLITKTPERRHWRRSGVFSVNFEHISHLFLELILADISWDKLFNVTGSYLQILEINDDNNNNKKIMIITK